MATSWSGHEPGPKFWIPCDSNITLGVGGETQAGEMGNSRVQHPRDETLRKVYSVYVIISYSIQVCCFLAQQEK